MSAAEVIREARNVLFERGWYKGSWNDITGRVCIRGAVGVALCGRAYGVLHDERGAALDHLLEDAVGTPSVADWNDAPERTFTDVIDALDRAEKIAESREAS